VIAWVRRAFDRLRFISRVSLSAALAWGCAGLVVAVAPPLIEPWRGASVPLRVLVQLSLGFGIGWWVGLIWGAAWAVRNRSARAGGRDGVPTRRIWLLAWLAATVVLAMRCAGIASRWAVLAGVAATSLAALVAPHARNEQR
jgi:hypothetical protein